jgi:hypothetical protein
VLGSTDTPPPTDGLAHNPQAGATPEALYLAVILLIISIVLMLLPTIQDRRRRS